MQCRALLFTKFKFKNQYKKQKNRIEKIISYFHVVPTSMWTIEDYQKKKKKKKKKKKSDRKRKVTEIKVGK